MNQLSNLMQPFYITPASETLPLTGRALEDAKTIDIFNKFLEKVELNQQASFSYFNGAFQTYSLEFGVCDLGGYTKEPIKEDHKCSDKTLNLCGLSAFDKPTHRIDHTHSFKDQSMSYQVYDKGTLTKFPDYLDVDSLESTMQSLVKKKIAELEKTIKVSQ